ncbi:GerW family sporulation protein [Paenibacillus turpanensis]|uniref:GerW family sporulation protein n=1 Tax=Paenibacillus turpanensis TaxID=2689078 RepID=UPI00140A9C7A|nr:GerW family sporulation protein [Paenibacillus turpanensis]
MSDHPIQGLMKTAMENIKEMVDVNTIVGDPVETPDGSVIMPISKVGFGFAAGGSEFVADREADQTVSFRNDSMNATVALPFGGGSGGGVSITPIAFLVVGKEGVKVVPLDNQTHIAEKLIDSAPQVVEKIQSMLKGKGMQQAQAAMGITGAASTTPAASGTSSTTGTSNTNNSNQPNYMV